MSHGYNPAGNVSGGQGQAAYQQQGQAAQSAQPQGSQQYAAPQSAPASGYQGAGGYPQGGQQYAGQQYAQPQQQGQQQFVQSGQGGAPQVASQQYAGAQYAQPQQYAAPQSAPASGQGGGGYVQGGSQQYAQPQAYAGQQRSYDPAQAEYAKLKSTATFAIWMAFVAFIAAPVIFLLGDCVHAQRLCSRAQAINAPEDVMKRVKLARGICAGLLLLQVVLIVVVVIAANM